MNRMQNNFSVETSKRPDLQSFLNEKKQNSEEVDRMDYAKFNTPFMKDFREELQRAIIQRMDIPALLKLEKEALSSQIEQFVINFSNEKNIQISLKEQRYIAREMISDMIGLGPIEVLFEDPDVTDILVNGPEKVFVERKGKLHLTDIKFRDNLHLEQLAQRIANWVGRRVDSSNPLCDARLLDGSRVNIAFPPISLDGASISIRRFKKNKVNIDDMVKSGNLGKNLAELLRIASRIALNVLVSGGTGSGKTTLLNALSSLIQDDERIITCEDAAELKLQQPHVLRMESRPPNIEGAGAITIRDLVKNALRMRPDRIIVGEVRGDECVDMLQAMNTGHDGSMSTIHANSAQEAVTRLENMVAMSGVEMPTNLVKQQIAGAIDLIVQTDRMNDGERRITEVVEVIGFKNGEVVLQTLYRYLFEDVGPDSKYKGRHLSSRVVPTFLEKAKIYKLDKELLKAMEI